VTLWLDERGISKWKRVRQEQKKQIKIVINFPSAEMVGEGFPLKGFVMRLTLE